MADIFTRAEMTWGGAFTTEFGLIGGAVSGLSGILMQNIGLNYSQNVNRIYEIGQQGSKTAVYYVGGRAQGQMGVGHILGPKLTIGVFYKAFSDLCNAQNNSIKLSLSRNLCGDPLHPFPGGVAPAGAAAYPFASSDALDYTAKYCVLVSVGINTQANDLLVNSQSQLMFSNLEFGSAFAALGATGAAAGGAGFAGGGPGVPGGGGFGAGGPVFGGGGA